MVHLEIIKIVTMGNGITKTSVILSGIRFLKLRFRMMDVQLRTCACKYLSHLMMASSNGNIFRVTGPLCVEFTGHRWIHKGHWRGALMFSLICAWNKRLRKQSWDWWSETPSLPLWRHCNMPLNGKEFTATHRGPFSIYISARVLAQWGRVLNICVSEKSHHCFR